MPLIDNLRQALDIEISYLEQRAIRPITLHNGTLTSSSAGIFIYEFKLDEHLNVSDDSPAQAIIGDRTYQVTIVSCIGLSLLIAFPDNLGDTISSLELRSDLTQLLKALRARLDDTEQAGTSFNKALATEVFEYTGRNVIKNTSKSRTFGKYNPDPSQDAAIQSAIGNDVTFIWGPPGTGKSLTIAWIIDELVRKGLRVLLTSNTRIAVDNALEDILDIYDDPRHPVHGFSIRESKVIRYGEMHTDRIQAEKRVHLDAIRDENAQPLLRQKQSLLGKQAAEERRLADLGRKIRIIEESKELLDKLKASEERIGDLKNRLIYSKREAEKLKANAEVCEQDLEKARNAWLFRNSRVNRAQQKLDEALGALRYKVREIEGGQGEIKAASAELSSLKTRLGSLEREREVKIDLSSLAQLNRAVEACEKRISQYQAELQEIANKILDVENRIFAEADIIATTLAKSFFDKRVYKKEYDVVVIDEVTMAILPSLYFVSGLAKQKVICVGDFRQLPAIVYESDPCVRQWMGRDIFDVNNLTLDGKGIDDLRARISVLNIQRRMHPNICSVVNDIIYNGLLQSKDTESHTIEGKRSVMLCDTTKAKPWASRPWNGSGRINIYHALAAIHFAQETAPLLAGQREEGGIGIITPYRKQANLLAKMVRDSGIDVTADNVHRFQGAQRDVVIFDFTDSPCPEGLSKFFTSPDSDFLRVLNVAITRAKKRLVIIANTDFLLEELHNSPITDILELLVNNRQVYEYVNSTDVIPNIITSYENDVLSQRYDEKTFYPKLLEDLQAATQKAIILCPFIWQQRMATTMDAVLDDLRIRGIDVTIVTRPPNEHRDSRKAGSYIDQWKRFGFTVIEKSRMHQKSILIDRNIYWNGSLNVFSHTNTSEEMWRFTGRDLVAEISKDMLPSIAEEVGVTTRLIPEFQDKACIQCGNKDLKVEVLRENNKVTGIGLRCPREKSFQELNFIEWKCIIENKNIPCKVENCDGIIEVKISRMRTYYLACSNFYPGISGSEHFGPYITERIFSPS